MSPYSRNDRAAEFDFLKSHHIERDAFENLLWNRSDSPVYLDGFILQETSSV
jgi:hypothetical protein